MKILIMLFVLMASLSATAGGQEDCSRMAAFRSNQQAKLELSRFGLGMITVKELDARQKEIRTKYREEVKECRGVK